MNADTLIQQARDLARQMYRDDASENQLRYQVQLLESRLREVIFEYVELQAGRA